MPSLVEAALQVLPHSPQLPPALLQQAYALDQQAGQLLTQRQQGILAGFAGLQAYSAALRLVLPQDYADSSHHSQWAQAIGSAADAVDNQVQCCGCCLCVHLQCGCAVCCVHQCDRNMLRGISSCNHQCLSVLECSCHDSCHAGAMLMCIAPWLWHQSPYASTHA